jgi:hypothetical protein
MPNTSRSDRRGRPGRPGRVPRRGVAALVGTVLGVAVLLSFKTPDTPVLSGSIGSGESPGTGSPGSSSSLRPSSGGGGGPATVIAGDLVRNPYGDVQVQITVSGGKIVDVKALTLPSDRQLSQRISQYVGPILRSEALAAQSSQIDLISGATYTSDSYVQSLQSAIDREGQ